MLKLFISKLSLNHLFIYFIFMRLSVCMYVCGTDINFILVFFHTKIDFSHSVQKVLIQLKFKRCHVSFIFLKTEF